jgi:ligand-binding sensor domain-containing protein
LAFELKSEALTGIRHDAKPHIDSPTSQYWLNSQNLPNSQNSQNSPNTPNPQNFLLSFLLVLLAASSVFAQTSPGDETAEETLSRSTRNLHQWGTISSFHGLPSERVRAIAQTSDGYLWFGTDNGLAKFDGRRVQTNIYSNLSSVPIRTLEVAEDDTLWIGSQKGAYFVRDGIFNLVDITEGSNINSILIEKDSVYFTTDNGIVYRSTESEERFFTTVVMRDEVPIQSSIREGSDVLFGSLNRGLLRIKDGKADSVITRPRPFFINVLKRDSKGNLWLGARSTNDNSGLFATSKFPNLRSVGNNLGTINAIAFDGLGKTWVGTDERGIFLFEGEKLIKRYSFLNTAGSLRSNQILNIFVDREGVVWIGTDEGVNRFDPLSPRNERVSDNTQSNFVRVVTANIDGRLFAGTNRGLYSSGGEGLGWKNVIEAKTIYVIEENGQNAWWIGTTNGLLVYDGETGKSEQVLEDKDIRAIARFDGKTYVADFGTGLIEFEDDEQRVILDERVVSLHVDGKEGIWIGTTGGHLHFFDGKTFGSPIPLTDGKKAAIWSITGNRKDGIWLSTNKGLFYLKDVRG